MLRLMCGPLIDRIQPTPRRNNNNDDDSAAPPSILMVYSSRDDEATVIRERANRLLEEEEAIRERDQQCEREIKRQQSVLENLECRQEEAQTLARRYLQESKKAGTPASMQASKRAAAKNQLMKVHATTSLIQQQQASLKQLYEINLRHEQARLTNESESALRVATRNLKANMKNTTRENVENTLNEAQDTMQQADEVNSVMSTSFTFSSSPVVQISDAELEDELDAMMNEEAPGSVSQPVTPPVVTASVNTVQRMRAAPRGVLMEH